MSVSKIRSDVTVVEKHHVAAKHLIEVAEQQAAALDATLRLINGAYNDPELNPNADNPIVNHFPQEVNNSIGRLRDVRDNLAQFKERVS